MRLNPLPLILALALSGCGVGTLVDVATAPVRVAGVTVGRVKSIGVDPATFQGIVLQKGLAAGGYGYFLTPLPKTAAAAGESGSVRLQAVP